MNRSIIVRGVGTATTKPDWVVLNLNLNAKDKDYEKAIQTASDQIDALNRALEGIGFEKNSLKTMNFNVNTEYEGVRDEHGNYRNVFVGYNVFHGLLLELEFDTARLNEVMTAISSCDARPELSIRFTVKEPSLVREELLRSAAENARMKAEVLAAASRVGLGRLLRIDYGVTERTFNSPTNYDLSVAECAEGDGAPMMAKRMTFGGGFAPQDIKSSDSAVFEWEINDK